MLDRERASRVGSRPCVRYDGRFLASTSTSRRSNCSPWLREILDVDTAAVLMLDRHTDELVAERHAASRKRSARAFESRWAAASPAVSWPPVGRCTSSGSTPPRSRIRSCGSRVSRSCSAFPSCAAMRSSAWSTSAGSAARPFTDQDTELLEIAADRIAGAGGNPAARGRTGGHWSHRAEPVAEQAPGVRGDLVRDGGMSRWSRTTSVAIGTTSSPCRPGSCGSWSATSPGTGLVRDRDEPYPECLACVHDARRVARGCARSRRQEGPTLRDRHVRDRVVRNARPAVRDDDLGERRSTRRRFCADRTGPRRSPADSR